MASINDDLIDLIQNFRCEQRGVVLQGLQFVLVFTVRPMAQHLSESYMLVSQLRKPVLVAVNDQPPAIPDKELWSQSSEVTTLPVQDAIQWHHSRIILWTVVKMRKTARSRKAYSVAHALNLSEIWGLQENIINPSLI